MAKAIIHNSDYQSVDECAGAINRYFSDRNKFYIKNPKKQATKFGEKKELNQSLAKAITAKTHCTYITSSRRKAVGNDTLAHMPG